MLRSGSIRPLQPRSMASKSPLVFCSRSVPNSTCSSFTLMPAGLEVTLDDLSDLLEDRVSSGNLESEREPVRLARFFEQLLGLLDAGRRVLIALAVGPDLLAEGRVGRRAGDVPQCRLGDSLPVHQMVHRLAQLLVVERRPGDVEPDSIVAETRLDGDPVVPTLLQFPDLHHGNRVYEVELTALEVLILDVLICYAPVNDLVELGQPFPPVVGVLLDGDVIAPDPLDELEWSRTDRIFGYAAIVLLYGLRRGYDARAVSQNGEERGERLTERHPHRIFIYGLDRLDGLHLGAPDGVLFLVAVEVVLHGLSIELRTVVELDALAQMEGVN